MNVKFTEDQIAFMRRIGISIDAASVLSDGELADLEDKLQLYYQANGLDEDYSPTPDGRLCESIIELLFEP